MSAFFYAGPFLATVKRELERPAAKTPVSNAALTRLVVALVRSDLGEEFREYLIDLVQNRLT